MTQKWYLSDTANSTGSPLTEQSATMPLGSAANDQIGSKLLCPSGSQVAGTGTVSSLGQTAQQSSCVRRFASPGLTAGTYGSGTWTVALGKVAEQNANANAFTRVSVYFWRPGTSSVVGYVYDAAADLGAEWPTTAAGRVDTFTGSNVTIQDQDRLVLEVWARATQGNTSSLTLSFQYGGATDVTAGSTTATGAYLNAPADIPVAPATVTATLAAPLGGLTGSLTATVGHDAALSCTLGALTATAAATPDHPATLTAALGGLSSSSTATVDHPATLAAALGGLTATAAATVEHDAVLTGDLGALTATATADVETTGGPATVDATLTADLGALTGTAAAGVDHPVTLAAPLGGLVAVGTATVEHDVVLAGNLGALTATAVAFAGVLRDWEWTAGRVEGAWGAAVVDGKWRAGRPAGGWRAGDPGGKWQAGDPGGKWN